CEDAAHICGRSLLLSSEHAMPTPALAARVLAASKSHIYPAPAGSLPSLRRDPHAAAPAAVIHASLEGDSGRGPELRLMKRLYRQVQVMGFVQRVYMKKMDPRELMRKQLLKQLWEKKGDTILLDMCEAGEKLMREEKGIYPNLDYYAAPVYWMLGIPIKLYTPIFFCARTVGLCAHIIEQYQNNRLYRPRVNYIGEPYD